MRPHRHVAISSLVVLVMALVACGPSGPQSTATKPTTGGTLTIDNESGSLWSCAFNPYNGALSGQSFGIIYEPLVYDNLLNDKKTPWLASSYQWSPDNKTLTFTIRSGVQWSDGQPFSAADVKFSFDLIKQHPALDLQSVWSVLSTVTQDGTDKIVMTFAQSSVPSFYQIAGQTAIVPQHIWSTLKDPVADPIVNPIGTGPFTTSASQCKASNVSYIRNPNYWQKGLPYLDKINYPAYLSNDPANLDLAAGNAQWGGQYIPNIDTYYVARDKAHNHYWFPPIDNINLWMNTTLPPLDNKVVRQAIAYGIDRASVSQRGESGYEPPGNQTGVLSPTFSSWIDTAQAAKYDYKFDPAKAAALLQGAGFTKNSQGIFQDASGKALSFKIITIDGYTDWDASLQVVQANLKQVGIDVTVKDQAGGDYFNNLFTGNFQLAYGSLSTSPGPSPYYELRNTLHSATTADIGQTAAGDYGRYKNPVVDSLLDQFSAASDPAQQHHLISEVEAIMLEDVPVIPVTEGVAWYEWTTKGFAGWPTPADQYAAPAPWNVPDWEVVLLHLYKTS